MKKTLFALMVLLGCACVHAGSVNWTSKTSSVDGAKVSGFDFSKDVHMEFKYTIDSGATISDKSMLFGVSFGRKAQPVFRYDTGKDGTDNDPVFNDNVFAIGQYNDVSTTALSSHISEHATLEAANDLATGSTKEGTYQAHGRAPGDHTIVVDFNVQANRYNMWRVVVDDTVIFDIQPGGGSSITV